MAADASYTAEHILIDQRIVSLDMVANTSMRGPGPAVGSFALESAIDELAYELRVDPLELRRINEPTKDPTSGHSFSSRHFIEACDRGAEQFGWRQRPPCSQRDGQWVIGQGVAAAQYHVVRFPAVVRVRINADGTALVQTSAQENGMGTATVQIQHAAERLGLPVENVRFEYGDTDLPNTSAAVGSAGAGMVSAAVHAAATALRDQVIAQAIADERSPLHNADPSSVVVSDGRMMLRDRPDSGETYGELLLRHRLQDTEALGSWTPPPLDTPYGLATFGAQFAEVAVDADLGLVRVRRLVGVFAPGRVLNPRTARSQLMGGMLWGLGQALLEATYMDSQRGRWANASLGEYLVAVNADAPDVEVDLVEVRDEVVNPLGVKGCGEIGQVGAAAAIANAVFHATGRRFHELPIRIEHLL